MPGESIAAMVFTVDRIKEIAERVASSGGFEVVEVELQGSGKARRLRVFIDKPQGVTHEDCANYSREIGTILDVEDAVPGGSYVLEVSSPGLDRKLLKPADFERFQGSLVKFSTHQAIEGNRHFQGRLVQFDGGELTVDLEVAGGKKKLPQQASGMLKVAYSNVEKAQLVPEF
jgi:ribosome maturation factor RimP